MSTTMGRKILDKVMKHRRVFSFVGTSLSVQLKDMVLNGITQKECIESLNELIGLGLMTKKPGEFLFKEYEWYVLTAKGSAVHNELLRVEKSLGV